MPTPLLKSLADKSGKSINLIEKMWNKIKNGLLKTYKESDSKFYPILVSIIKKKLNISEGIISFKEFLQEELNKRRYTMPQIEDYKDFCEWMQNGDEYIDYVSVERPASELEPSQKEFNDDKVQDMIENPYVINKKPIIVSKENIILDGHHRWKAAMKIDKDYNLWVIKFTISFDKLLEKAKEYSGSKYNKL